MKKGFVIIFFIAILFLMPGLLKSETRVYEEKTKNRVITHRFLIEESASGYLITLRSETGGQQIAQKFQLDKNLAALSWDYEEPAGKTRVTANRKGNEIFLRGLYKGKKINKTFKINELPWNQTFNLGLEKFAISTREKMKFWSIGTSGPGDMKITTFNVKKKGVEKITLNRKGVAAVHVQISLTGLLSLFWKGHYWYRKADGTFLRYKGKGGPGSSLTIMELTSKKPTGKAI